MSRLNKYRVFIRMDNGDTLHLNQNAISIGLAIKKSMMKYKICGGLVKHINVEKEE